MSRNLYEKLNIITPYQNRVKTDFEFFMLELFFEERRWVHANPTIYDKGSMCEGRYKEYYVYEKNISVFQNFYNDLISKKSKFVILRGKRGSGKTSFLNFFLNDYTRKLNNEGGVGKGYTWIRIDTTKIYKNETGYNKHLSFQDYLYGQLLFVYFRYQGENGKCKTSIRLPDEEKVVLSCDPIFASVTKEMLVGDDPKLAEQYTEARKRAQEPKNFTDGLDKPFYDYNALADKLLKLIAKQLILIIDGIDNINYSSLVKHAVWNDLETFLGETNKSELQKIVLVLRDENSEVMANKYDFLNKERLARQNLTPPPTVTPKSVSLTDIVAKMQGQLERTLEKHSNYDQDLYSEFLKSLLKIYLKVITDSAHRKIFEGIKEQDKKTLNELQKLSIDSLSDKELKTWLNKDIFIYNIRFINYLKKDGYDLIDNIQKALAYLLQNRSKPETSSAPLSKEQIKQNRLNNFFVYAKHFETLIIEAFQKLTKATIKNPLQEIFNGDMREMFILSYKSYILFTEYILAKKDSELENYDSFEHFVKDHYFVAMRFLFQNGNLYHGTRDDIIFAPPYRNINFINLFNITDSRSLDIEPIVFVFILNYLTQGKYSQLDIAERFRLKKRFVSDVCSELLEFGYIDVTFGKYNSEPYYTTTHKGRHILAYSLVELPVLQNYIYGALVKSSHRKYFQVWQSDTYASRLLFNVSLFWFDLQQQAQNLRRLNVDFDIISEQAKQNYRDFLAKSFSEHFVYKDIRNFIKDNKALQDELINFVKFQLLSDKRKINPKYRDDSILKNSSALEELAQKLSLDERCVYLNHFFDKDADTIVNDMRLHRFVFGNLDPDKEQERKETIRSTIHKSSLLLIIRDFEKKLA
jgi:hypothetical protein